MAFSEIILPPGNTSADLQTAVDNAALGDTIVISGDMPFTNTVTIPEGKEVTIESDAENIWTMSSPGDNIRHFLVDGSLILQNITIDGGKDAGGIENYGTLTMNTGTVIQNCYRNDSNGGGGVRNLDGTFNMLGGTISGNTASDSGGVLNYATFTMTGGEISGNTALYGSGGVTNSTTFTMYDGTISGNTVLDGGGSGVVNSGQFDMFGGTISNNTSTRYGGGVWNDGEFTMYDGIISGNTTSFSGGGVFSYDTFTMNGGEISGNATTGSGGGVFIDVHSTFTMNGGTISDNEASEGNGGGICLSDDDNLSITGQSYITNNSAPNGNGGGIYTDNTAYGNLITGSDTVFSCNWASAAYAPPADAAELYPNIEFASTSITNHPLNNFDINYTAGEPIDVFFNVNYNANGGIGSYRGPDIVPGDTDTVLRLVDTGISYPGYAFTGWNTEPDGSGISYTPGDDITLDCSVTLYAQWAVEQEYTVMYNANGGNGSHTDSERQYGTNYTILLPIQTGITRPGYTFTGWNTEPDGSGLSYAPGDIITITGNVVLYAQWRQNTESKPERICPKPVTKCRTALEGQKIWIDDDNIGDTRPDTIEILLLRDGAVYKRTIVDSENDWAFGFCCLPVWKNSGNKYIYTIDEADVPSYTKTIEGYNVTNTLTP